MDNLTLILGGARSGKSAYAERLAAESVRPVLYVATAQALDDEMSERIRQHRERRPANWRTLEAPRWAGMAIAATVRPGECVLVDCVSLLVSNTVLEGGEEAGIEEVRPVVEAETRSLLEASLRHDGPVILVSNEVGMGIVPAYPIGRVYRDLLGWANQRLAAEAARVFLLVAGLPMKLK